MKIPHSVCCVIVALCLVPTAAGQDTASPVVRVLIRENLEELSVHGLDLEVRDSETGLLKIAGTDLRFLTRSGRLLANGRDLGTARVSVGSPAVFLDLNGQEYRGPVEVRASDGRINAISYLKLEDYVVGTLAGEMPASWPMEALKAQAVVSRSYAVAQLQKSSGAAWDLVADVRDQVYRGSGADQIKGAQAVRLTRGIVLTKDGGPVQTFFHSTCGGVTEIAANVWPAAPRDIPAVVCGYCGTSPASRWRLAIDPEELAALLRESGLKSDRVLSVDVARRSPSGRALEIRLTGSEDHISLDGNSFRRLLGYDRLKSTRFTVRADGGQIVFEGSGYGHGVGMCQWGARGMALKGKTAEEILTHYYPGTQRTRVQLRLRPGPFLTDTSSSED